MFKKRFMKVLSIACFMLIAGMSLTHSAKASVQKLLTGDLAGGDNFGSAVSVSGDTAVIGAAFDDDNKGSAYIFVRSSDNVWQLQQKLFAGDGAAKDEFGRRVSISGDTVAVSSPFYKDGGETVGAVYIFVRSGSSWSQQAKLLAADRQPYDQFGSAVSIDGDTVVIGNFVDQENGLQYVGSAYVFVRSGSSWSQQAKLLAADGATNDYFGLSVSVDGETAIVGAEQYTTSFPGKAYVFVRSGSSWSQQAKLLASDGQPDDMFGEAVAVDGDTAVIGAKGNGNNGAAYIFTRTGSIWSEVKKITGNTAAGSWFGGSVSVSGDTILIGDEYEGNNCPGAAYVFTRSGTDWTEQARLVSTDDDTFMYQYFGFAVALDGDTAVIGEPGYFSDDPGSAYAFNFACGYSLGRNLPASTWLMTAPSCQPSNPPGISINAQYGDDISGGVYGTNWIGYSWNKENQDYVQQTENDQLQPGFGSWLYSLNAATLSLTGTATTTTDCAAYGSSGQCVDIDLIIPSAGQNSWNFIGYPFPYMTDWSTVQVAVSPAPDGSGSWKVYSPSQAETAGYVSRIYYSWNGSSYSPHDDSTLGSIGVLRPQEAVWVRSLGSYSGPVPQKLKLLIPAQ